MTEKKDSLGSVVGAPWHVRLALRLGRGGLMRKFHALFVGRPGLLRTLLAAFILVDVALSMASPDAWKVFHAVAEYLGVVAQASGVPVDVPALADLMARWWKETLALFAVLRPLYRWAVGVAGTAATSK